MGIVFTRRRNNLSAPSVQSTSTSSFLHNHRLATAFRISPLTDSRNTDDDDVSQVTIVLLNERPSMSIPLPHTHTHGRPSSPGNHIISTLEK